MWRKAVPVQYGIDKKRGLVITTAWDRLTFAEMKSHQDQLLSDPDFDPYFNQLADLSGVTAQDTSTEEIKALARREVFSPASRRAYLAPKPSIFSLTRIFEAHHSMSEVPSQVGVFQDIIPAWEWIGSPSATQS
jgi:hypothetical protein